ncbi:MULTISPECIES: LysR family transcriptional regulator [unclassified Janthinobacterium]|uniref:LysR family transcriptional regulator n=1 Tax=unclassified Janthinobacterium TaxID=2610881 RepID=UPI00034DAD66|nr:MULTISPECIES: LysR family transcriptional regulator [unclassified Janthinobacterium]MEC5163877.1 DNA-binding transcriptional LysR family regulator [Janthinobacterium sp. CG_S6]
MDQLAALRALRRVVELGSFTKAGAALGVSHTAVSRHVSHLEAHLGAQLLNRTTRRFALTEAGQRYYDASRQILDALDAADRAAAEQQARPAGSLRINAPMAFGALELAHWLPQFLARYPELRIDLVCNDRIVDLIEDGFDVALRLTSKLPDSTLIARRLASSGVALVAAPAYLERHGAPRTPQELLAHNCLSYTLAAQPRDWDFTGPDGAAHHVSVQGNLQANTGIALCAAAVGGLGIAAAAAFIVRDELAGGGLVRVLPDYAIAPRELYALYPQNRHLSPKVRAFVDFAAELYRTRRWD